VLINNTPKPPFDFVTVRDAVHAVVRFDTFRNGCQGDMGYGLLRLSFGL
jgi:hypothetical protein